VIKNYYQIGSRTIRVECLAEFLVSLLTEPLFDILRTHEQLGYGISCCCRKTHGSLGITITVEYQENKNSSNVIDEKIEEFLLEYQSTLNSMSNEDFSAAKRCFLSTKLSHDTDLEIEVNRNFEEIRNPEIIFNRSKLNAKEIESISKEEIFKFYQEIFITKSNVRKLSIQIIGNSEQLSHQPLNGRNKSEIVNEKQNVMINDLKLFQESIKVGS
jgi:nardilysin